MEYGEQVCGIIENSVAKKAVGHGELCFDEIGYNKSFLGEDYEVSLLSLSESMIEDTAKMQDGNYVLDYVHFSLVMKHSRGLAYFTAVNIDGKNYVKIPRGKDAWRFDSRIDENSQRKITMKVQNNYKYSRKQTFIDI